MTTLRITLGVTLMLGGYWLATQDPTWAAWLGVALIIAGAVLILNPRGIFQHRAAQR